MAATARNRAAARRRRLLLAGILAVVGLVLLVLGLTVARGTVAGIEVALAILLLLASYARNEVEARYLVNLMILLVAERRGEGGGRIVLIGTGVALDVGTKRKPALVLPLPVDKLGWNEQVARFFAAEDFAITDKTVLITGTASLPAARALVRSGWSIVEHVRYEGAPAYALQ